MLHVWPLLYLFSELPFFSTNNVTSLVVASFLSQTFRLISCFFSVICVFFAALSCLDGSILWVIGKSLDFSVAFVILAVFSNILKPIILFVFSASLLPGLLLLVPVGLILGRIRGPWKEKLGVGGDTKPAFFPLSLGLLLLDPIAMKLDGGDANNRFDRGDLVSFARVFGSPLEKDK